MLSSTSSMPTLMHKGTVLPPRRSSIKVHASATDQTDTMGFKMMRKGVKEAANETVLTPRFYTTDFEKMEEIFDPKKNPNIDMAELEACLNEFKTDYNQKHFVRNEAFKKAAATVTGPTRKIFIEFLERSCTAEFSGFLLYKELGRRLKKANPVVAEIFTLMSRDEARHAGFLNKAMSDFGLALDLGFLTQNRAYTFFEPKFILYATYLSEKIGYWRYISIYRHLQRNPDFQIYPIFEYFENWCQDENRHGDFFSALLKSQPDILNEWSAKLWSRFFCLSVYITMYLNDHQRKKFYGALGLDSTIFNQHVIVETNRTTERVFPAVPDVEHPDFFKKMDKLVELNTKLVDIGSSDIPDVVKNFQRAPIIAQMVAGIVEIYFMKPVDAGSWDFRTETQMAY
eukprot:g7554.t1